MFEDDEDIYDDTGDTGEEMNEPSGLSAIKARFEGAQSKFETPPLRPKPNVTSKPKVLPKYGGGPGLNVCAAGDKKDGNVENAFKPKSAINTVDDNSQDKPSEASFNGPGKKRDSKVNIPEAFRQKLENASVEVKPKTAIKPPKWGSDSNNNAKINGISPSKNKEALENALSQKFGALNSVKPVKPPQSPTGKVSPRENTTDSSIPKTQSDSPKPNSPRGVGSGADVLAKVAALTSDSNVDFKAKLKHVELKKTSPASVAVKPIIPIGPADGSNAVQWRNRLKSAKNRENVKSVRTVIRVIDGKRFLKNTESCLGDDSPPEKPAKLDCDIDVNALEQDYKDALENIVTTEKEQHGWTEVEETYDDCGNLQSTRAVSLMGNRPKPKPRKSKKVPLIEPMTEDEELSEAQWNEAGFNGVSDSTADLPAPPPGDQPKELLDDQETYDDVGVEEAVPEDEVLVEDEMYEELPEEPLPESSLDVPPPVGPKPPEPPSTPLPKAPTVERSESENEKTNQQIVDAKEQKRLEKERKKKEKEEKEMLKNKEKELKKLLKVLGHKVTAELLTTSVGKGKVKSNAKGKEKTGELALTEGDEVDIIRMIDNPSGKWLVRVLSSQKGLEHAPKSPLELIGYCDEKNIEFMKSAEHKPSTPAVPEAEEQDTYEFVEGEDDLAQDEIYEECN
ncbi:FYN-binding protein 1-like isoform X3 [Ruditapes philippinarum]|uniref:FYN-binding protein 1-like isoform X3 n=1 Tax=Ruditapes philippinarum TaxID=129788 RepID=UPI00295AFB8A|nr:FYN-binding protein 1-like isoform X3 [Ruditapes philippinarum]